jgi:DNA-binding MarR family transcriptional regulator
MPAETTPSKEELLQQTIDRFWETIPSTWNRVRSNLRSTAAEHFGITVEQFHILRHINRGIISMSDLAVERCTSRPAISQAVDVLVNKGLLTRQQNADDRRYINLVLTKNGAALLKSIFDRNRAWMKSKLDALDQADLSAAIQAMQVLKKTFENL